MPERLDQIIDSVHLAYTLTGFDIDKCPKADQVENLNEARAWLLDVQSELEALRRDEAVHETAADVWEQARREAARYPLEAQREAK